MELGMEICQCKDLLDCIKSALPGRIVEEKRPEYIPPVILHSGALTWLARAVAAMAEVTSSADAHCLTIHYADTRDASGCRLVVAVYVTLAPEEDPLRVHEHWATLLGNIHHELLVHSVDFHYSCNDGFLHYEFEFPVFGYEAATRKHRNCVLLVEDDPFVRNSTREILESEGYRVLAAEDGDHALKEFRRHFGEVGLVISDLTMPGQDGRTLARNIRAEDRQVPILLISGYAAFVEEDLAAQIYFLAKPYNARTLSTAVARCLRGYHQSMFLPELHPSPSAWL